MPTAPELSRRVQVNSLGRQDGVRRGSAFTEIVVEAAASELPPLARRLDIPAVQALWCRFRLSAMDDAGRVVADGLLTASLTRVCVTSLEEFQGEVVEAFRIRFVPGDALDPDGDEALDPDADDDIPYEGTGIDLGEAAVEQLALAMEPYPRKPGVELPSGIGSVETAPDGEVPEPDGDDGGRPNPFAALLARKPS